MNVKIISPIYPNVINYIAENARICYGKEFEDKEKNDLMTVTSLLNRGHHSVFECVYIEWLVEGISRACSHQIVRHRCASYLQQSQRYVKYDKGSNFWKNIVMPEPISKNTVAMQIYDNLMNSVEEAYLDLIALGIKPEDARYVTTQAHTTTLKIGMNLREFLFNFYPLRSSKKAQDEIRELAENMRNALFEHFCKQKDFWQFINIYDDWKEQQNRPEWR